MDKLSLSGIYIYPIKSLGGIALSHSKVEMRGLQYDRRWMLVDENQRFLTQRNFKKMAALLPQINAGQLSVSDRLSSLSPLDIPMDANEYPDPVQVQIWKDSVLAYAAKPAINQWFSEALSLNCRLVYMAADSHRPVDANFARSGEEVSFADGYPFLLASEASFAELNQRLEEAVPMNRFRANLIVKGGTAFQEDQWGDFRIGNLNFRGVKPCSRCVMITINQQTMESRKEPLKTLASYRSINGKVKFGENICWIPGAEQSIQVGDSIEVLS